MWGKAREEMGDEKEKEEGHSHSHSHNLTGNKESHEDQRVPLLESYNTQRYSSDHHV